MSVSAFVAAPEVKAAATHLYIAPVPEHCFAYGEMPAPHDIYSLEISASPRCVTATYRLRQGCGNPFERSRYALFDLKSDSEDICEQMSYLAWRELAGHVIPYAAYSSKEGGMVMKLSSADELDAPHGDFKHPVWTM